ncbi:MAG: response regulator [Euryarchaeota archaeon]|nr:response regulator [Euryarchaeota archaeon]
MKMKVMVVDDEPDILRLVEEMLGAEGYEVIGCLSGEECLNKVEKEKPKLILMDIMMPGLNGWETTKKLKQNPKTRQIPVAMLTVKYEKEDKIRSFQDAKCDAYIVKPIDRKELVKVVRWLTEGVV